ncbi:MAG: hypothetical protein KIT84_06035 [Labilithrix sp.]|nr:hypothetical protein [Labilithrix sp.]MCW5810550.1 hypothetical protein [Labilithrix sp.]
MKFRAIIVAASMTAAFASLMHCGGDDDNNAMPDGGSTSSSTSGQIIPINEGGSTSTSSGTVGICVPKTCADLEANCGPQGDGCGGIIESCGTCTEGQETCGGGGAPSRCGGSARCIPQSCEDLKFTCGPAGDGCGGKIDSCGSCSEPQICGGGGTGRCGGGILGLDGGLYYADGGPCQPRTTCAAGECGFVANGCGDLLECGGCGPGEICGLNAPSICAAPTCTKTTCTAQGANCGYVADGCGGLLDCGGPNACAAAGQICGGGGPNKCGTGVDGGPDIGCVNFCLDQQKNDTCAPGQRTKLTGTVYAPNGKLPIPDAIVFVPNGSKTSPWGLPTFTDGVANAVCEQCTLQSLGTPLVATKTAADGTFTLDNVPPEIDFPLVIQLGRWRRVVTIPARTSCTSTALTPEQTRFPKKQNEGSPRDTLPLLAVSTGSVDALECVLYKLGVDRSEFTNPSATPGGPGGRIRLYQDNTIVNGAKGGARIDINTPRTDQALTSSAANLNQYDAVIFGCPGGENNRDDGTDDRVRAYADRGGRVYATHFNYVYLYDRAPWDSTTPWNTTNPQSFATVDALVNKSFPKGATFGDWLGVPLNTTTGVGVGALKTVTPPTVQLEEARGDARLFVSAGAQAWLTQNVLFPEFGTPVFHYTFNTPLGAPPANQCGRVLFSDFHVTLTAGASTENQIFPAECGGDNPAPLTVQEKILAFFLFDLTSCITPDVPPPTPTCKKLTCADQDIQCGFAGDGCGEQLNCNPCPTGQLCVGTPARCITPACSPSTCEAQGAECGMVSNGCGQSVTCPPCDAGLTCGGSGPNKCGKNDCTPKTCQEQNIGCGHAGDGCGAPLFCGDCPPGQTCGGGGVPNQCGAPSCVARTCQQAGANCGPVADGCGGILQCGICRNDEICGIEAPSRCGKAGPQ